MKKITTLLFTLTACQACGAGPQTTTYGQEVLNMSERFCTVLQDPCGYDFADNGFTEQQCIDVTADSICDNGPKGVCDKTLEPHNVLQFTRCLSDLEWYSENNRCEQLWTSQLPSSCVLVIDLRDEL